MSAKPTTIHGYWDFSTIEEISPPCALVIASEYDRIRRSGGWVPRAIDIEKWNENVRGILSGIGFFDLCGIDPQGDRFVDYGKLRILRFLAGEKVDGQQVGELLSRLDVPELFNDYQLYSAVVEGITNIRHHAYPEGHEFLSPHIPDWWMFGMVNRETRRVYITIYDQGVGIPTTLPHSDLFGSLRKVWRRILGSEPDLENDHSKDGMAIALAMKVGRTRTNEEYRGKGLAFMESMLDLCKGGGISIYSRRGAYFRQEDGKRKWENRNVGLAGTLVIWTLGY